MYWKSTVKRSIKGLAKSNEKLQNDSQKTFKSGY